MAGRFAAFSFVDRIDAHAEGAPVRGRYTIPATAGRFPPSLAAEAVGQLAAWVAMRRLGFRVRPVAGLAGETRYGSAFGPGDTLDLEVDLEAATDTDVAYHGRASVGGQTVLTLERALGPMLPADEFDDPAALARDFATLAGPGAPPGRFDGVPPPRLELDAGATRPGERAAGRLAIPTDAPYFADHFPRKPVYPATLLMEALSTLASIAAGGRARVSGMQDVKVRQFMPPGATLEVSATVASDGGGWSGRVAARLDGKPAATAKVLLEAA
ncbi:MAG: hypothetical protein U1F51_15810 [Burkholderiales bacterium]